MQSISHNHSLIKTFISLPFAVENATQFINKASLFIYLHGRKKRAHQPVAGNHHTQFLNMRKQAFFMPEESQSHLPGVWRSCLHDHCIGKMIYQDAHRGRNRGPCSPAMLQKGSLKVFDGNIGNRLWYLSGEIVSVKRLQHLSKGVKT